MSSRISKLGIAALLLMAVAMGWGLSRRTPLTATLLSPRAGDTNAIVELVNRSGSAFYYWLGSRMPNSADKALDEYVEPGEIHYLVTTSLFPRVFCQEMPRNSIVKNAAAKFGIEPSPRPFAVSVTLRTR